MPMTALVPIAEGFEEIEAVCIIDTLRRAGIEVTVAGVGGCEIAASRGVRLKADAIIDDCADRRFDAVVLPGGMPGSANLAKNETVLTILKKQQAAGRLYAAICAVPAVVLEPNGLLGDRTATCHPGFVDKMRSAAFVDARVAVAGSCITSRGPGTALEFALRIVEALAGIEKAREIGESMVMMPEQLP